MPADADHRVDDQLTRLRSDLGIVDWADPGQLRRRGVRRHVQRAASTGIAVVAGVGLLGYSVIAGIPSEHLTPVSDPPATLPGMPRPTPTGILGTALRIDPEPPRARLTAGGAASRYARPKPTHAPPEHRQHGPVTRSSTPPPSVPTASSTGTAPPPVIPEPTPTTAPPAPSAPPLTADALLSAAEMPTVNDSGSSWADAGTSAAEGSAAAHCQSGDLAGLGAVQAVRRDFTWGAEGTVTGTNVVGRFGTDADAVSAYDTFRGWLTACGWGQPHGPTSSDAGDQAGWWWVGHDNGDGTGQIEVVGLVRTGAQLSVVVWHEDGQDFSYGADPMAATLMATADRLATSGGS
ncbi:hypothetical protein SAMN05421678_101517 [Actinopolymorpha cephalotaxi]|uniref:PknH-like extracellular domain-containing protein n=1 Tax=Actinopolymorpha cephalotaxi TaxID=504797 RepID=A0A1I2KUL0_9ACTN|nr:hypothetical protein [Actinopolymorpha cephalotaxi]NYH84660.1 hypothetical protein [Actinopolymorpha cephalotaxi]SFF70233.1 hypothetical protein SAMN05421678_101517 [Actinopolymorpha cephalotaxi]